MKRTSTVCVAIALALMVSSVSQATLIFGFDKAGLRGLTKYSEDPSGQSLLYTTPAKTDSGFGPVPGYVGVNGSFLDLSIPIFPKIMNGAGSQNLAGYDEFAMTLFDDNDDIWTAQLYVDINRATVAPDETAPPTFDITGLGAVDSVGFVISSNRNDTFHISAEAGGEQENFTVYEQATIALLGPDDLQLPGR